MSRKKLNDNNLITNIGNINYVLGEQKINNFIKVTKSFCDNIMVVKITDSTDLVGNFVRKEACRSFSLYLRNTFFQKFKLAKHGVSEKKS